MTRLFLLSGISFCLFVACNSAGVKGNSTDTAQKKGSLFSFLSFENRASASVPDYIRWVEDSAHGMISKRMIGRIVYRAQYCPVDYSVLREIGLDAITSDKLIQGRKENGKTTCMIFTIEDPDHAAELMKSGISSQEAYQERIQYCSFYIQNDLYLIDGIDTLPCRVSHFERTYGIAPYAKFTLLFDKNIQQSKTNQHSDSDKTLVYFDRMFQSGIVKMKIKAEDLAQVPELIIN